MLPDSDLTPKLRSRTWLGLTSPNYSNTGKITLLVLLDLYAAFDTVDYKILPSHMKERIGIDGTALN